MNFTYGHGCILNENAAHRGEVWQEMIGVFPQLHAFSATTLFVPQSHNRIDFCGPPRGQIRRQYRYANQQQCHSGECKRVSGANLK
jgi:hypothetical protein